MSGDVIRLFMSRTEAQRAGCTIHRGGVFGFCKREPMRMKCFGHEPEWCFVEDLSDFPREGWLKNTECECHEIEALMGAVEGEDCDVCFADFRPECERPFFNVRRKRTRSGPCRARVYDFATGKEIPVGR